MDEKSSELIVKLQRGEGGAFEKIFERYKIKAVRTAYLITGDRALADDIVQEAFITCYRKIGGLKEPEQFEVWFFRILTRIAWKVSKKERAIVPVENIFEVADYRDTGQIESDLIHKEYAECLRAEVERLELKQKTVIFLYYYSGFSVKEIARITGCLEGTVKSRLYHARKNLGKSLKNSEGSMKEGAEDAAVYKI